MPAPATISHTSLPSHSGPIVLMASRRSSSLFPTMPWSIPTPKSKPSRTRNPVHNTAMAMNQNVCMPAPLSDSVGHRGHRRLALFRWLSGGELPPRVPHHEDPFDDRQHAVEQRER